MRDKIRREILSRLRYFANQGVRIYLNGQLSSPEEISEIYYVNEDSVYMPDYVISDKGRLEEVRYDKITEGI